MSDMYPWIERHTTFLHNWDETNAFISEVLQEAEDKFGKQRKQRWFTRFTRWLKRFPS